MKSLALTFDGNTIHASRGDAWINATEMGAIFDKRPADWRRLPDAIEYLDALCRKYNVGKSHFIKTQKGKGGGTWFHPKLAIPFARWLSADFAVWCDEQIHDLLSGGWQQERDLGKGYYRMMSDVIQMKRLEQGEDVKPHHFMTDAKLIGWAITGVFKGIDRDKADKRTLSAINTLMSYNAALVMKGLSYDERKPLLWEKANPYRETALLEA